MTPLRRLLNNLRALVRGRRRDDAELSDELRGYLDAAIDAKVAAGLTRADAERAARVEIGSAAAIRDRVRDVGWGTRIDDLWRDVRYAVRGFRRAPVFTAFALVTLALGIGGTTAVFSVVDGVLLKPLSYPDPDRLVDVRQSAQTPHIDDLPVSPSQYFVFRDQNHSVIDAGLYTDASATITGHGSPERVDVMRVTDGVLPILGVVPTMGRIFTPADDRPDAPPTAIVTDAYWRNALGGDASAIGRSLVVDGAPVTIVGVLPRSFQFLDFDDLSLVLPLRLSRGTTMIGDFNYSMIARLRPGATSAMVDADIARGLPVVARSFPSPPGINPGVFENAGFVAHTRPLKQAVVGDVGNVLWIVMGTIAFVLVIACANVGNLLLVRAEGRRQEMAVRAALGASTHRIAAGLLVESLALGLAGGALGVLAATGAVRALTRTVPAGLPRVHEIGIDIRSVSFAIGISLLAGVVFGWLPLARQRRLRLTAALHGGSRSATSTRAQRNVRAALVVVQVALALVVLVSSGLMIRTYHVLTHVDPGFTAPASVQTFRMSIPEAEVADPERVVRVEEEILRHLAAIPGVTSAGLSNRIPMDGGGSIGSIFVKGRTYPGNSLPPVHQFKTISPAFLQTLGTPLVAGRDFTWSDVDEGRHVALVSDALARELWRSPLAAIGQFVRGDDARDDWSEVVGVVADVRDNGVSQPAPTTVYWPQRLEKPAGAKPFVRRNFAVAIRSERAGTSAFMAEVRQAVWTSVPTVPLASVRTLDVLYRRSMARTSFTLVMLLIAGGVALLLGVVGLYSVIAYAVTQRTREIGIRAALGARPWQLAGAFVRAGLWLTVIGLVGGVAAALALTRLMTSLLFGVSPFDPLTYALVCGALIATACLASYIPARRATRVDPVVALRAE
jgi:predicted permease